MQAAGPAVSPEHDAALYVVDFEVAAAGPELINTAGIPVDLFGGIQRHGQVVQVGRADRHGVEQLMLRIVAGDAVHRQALGFLEGAYRVFDRGIIGVGLRAGVVALVLQLTDQVQHRSAPGAGTQGCVARFVLASVIGRLGGRSGCGRVRRRGGSRGLAAAAGHLYITAVDVGVSEVALDEIPLGAAGKTGFSVVGERGAGFLDDGDQVTPDALADVHVVHRGGNISGRGIRIAAGGSRNNAAVAGGCRDDAAVPGSRGDDGCGGVAGVAGNFHAVAADVALDAVLHLDEVPGIAAAPYGRQQVGEGFIDTDLREGGAADGGTDVHAALDGHDIAEDLAVVVRIHNRCGGRGGAAGRGRRGDGTGRRRGRGLCGLAAVVQVRRHDVALLAVILYLVPVLAGNGLRHGEYGYLRSLVQACQDIAPRGTAEIDAPVVDRADGIRGGGQVIRSCRGVGGFGRYHGGRVSVVAGFSFRQHPETVTPDITGVFPPGFRIPSGHFVPVVPVGRDLVQDRTDGSLGNLEQHLVLHGRTDAEVHSLKSYNARRRGRLRSCA